MNKKTEHFLRKNKLAVFLAAILCLILLAAVFAPWVAPHDPYEINLEKAKEPPQKAYPFGTDAQGRCILSRMIYGARISLFIGFCATASALFIGVLFGTVAAYFGGIADNIITFLIDVTLSLPGLLVAIAITVVFEPGVLTVLIALCIVGWAGFARIIRSSVISIKGQDYVASALVLGLSRKLVMLKYVLPNIIPIIFITASLRIGVFILSEASLSFLGLGISPPEPTWGGMIASSVSYVETAPWMAFFPGVALAVTIFCFNLIGDSMKDYVNFMGNRL
ncbi:MAG: ABC transporter permease [Candidatus Aureabacteria bacterium]|nr:ABC transporter permease [Candidatus Auribacterota bacterium]